LYVRLVPNIKVIIIYFWGIMKKFIHNHLALKAGLALCGTGLLFLSACALKDRVVDVNNTFLEDVDIKQKIKNLPFQHSWRNPNFTKTGFTSIYYKPIRVDLVDKDKWERSASTLITSEQDYLDKTQEIANYFYSELIHKTRDFQPKKFLVLKEPNAKSVVVEIVLTEIEFSHPLARAASLAAPVPGTGPALTTITDPHVAFAARITDGETGALIATLADRKFGPTRIIDFNKLTVSSSAREVTALWAQEIAETLQGRGITEVSEKSFDWKPW
jgi:hypothetical protein